MTQIVMIFYDWIQTNHDNLDNLRSIFIAKQHGRN